MKFLRENVADAIDELDKNAKADQYPARRMPKMFSAQFGPITGPIVARNNSGTAQENTGTLATPGTYITPPNGPIYVGRDGRFVWCRTAVHAHLSLTWSANPGDLPTNVKAWGTRLGGLFDDVVIGNGGGLIMDQFAYVPVGNSDPTDANSRAYFTFAWRLGLYDKRRDRYIHDGDSLPSSEFNGGLLNKQTAMRTRFDEDTEIEPRLYIDELTSILDFSATDLTDIQWRAYLNFSMLGFIEQNEDRGRGRDADGDGRSP